MPRKKFGEEGEVGRILGGMSRAGYTDVLEELKAQAQAEGKKLTEKMAEVLRIGLSYDKYSDVDLATAFKVMDFIERLYSNLIYPTMVSASRITLESDIEKIRTIAEAMGYMHRDQAEALAELKAREYLKNVLENMKQKEQKELTKEQEGALTKFFSRLAEKLADRLGEEAIARIVSSGKLDDFVNMVSNVALESLGETMMEEMMGGEHEEQAEQSKEESKGGET